MSDLPEKIAFAYPATSTVIHIVFTNSFFSDEGLDAAPQQHACGKLALNAVVEEKAPSIRQSE